MNFEIPPVIQAIKEHSGLHWRNIKRILNRYIEAQNQLKVSRLDIKFRKRLELLHLNDTIRIFKAHNDFGRFNSYVENALKTLRKIGPRADIHNFINDWKKQKSGNKKYFPL